MAIVGSPGSIGSRTITFVELVPKSSPTMTNSSSPAPSEEVHVRPKVGLELTAIGVGNDTRPAARARPLRRETPRIRRAEVEGAA